MEPERWQQIKAACEALDSAPPEEHAELLHKLCAGDAELRREVERYFQLSDQSPIRNAIRAEAGLLVHGNAFADPPVEYAGLTIGPYRLTRKIGEGGMGQVYAADDARMGRQVAVKLLRQSLRMDSSRLLRFQQEARVASALNHPNIVTIYDFGESGSLNYIVTEFVQGRTLRQILGQQPLSVPEILEIATQICSALSAAHDAGIVHRDIKPENVLVRPDGYVKVLDFGLAKLTERGSNDMLTAAELSNSGVLMGTAAYMSPEQIRGAVVDGRSDLFSLGVVLYEMVSQRQPFTGDTVAHVLTAILDREPAALDETAAASPKLDAIIRRCLRKDRGQRYSTAADLLVDLRNLKLEIDSSSSLGSPLAIRRRQGWRLAVGAAGAALLASLAAAFYFGVFREADWFTSIKVTTMPGSLGLLSPSGRYMVYGTVLRSGERQMRVRQISSPEGAALTPPARTICYPLAISPDESYLYYTAQPSDSVVQPTLFRVPLLGGSPQKILDNVFPRLALSRDGSKFAFVRANGDAMSLVVAPVDAAGWKVLGESREVNPYHAVTWAANGREVVYAEGRRVPDGQQWRLLAVGLEGGKPRLVADLGRRRVVLLATLPDGGFIANADDPETGLPQLWHISASGKIRQITRDVNEHQGLALSRDGKRLFTSQTVRHSEIWDIDVTGSSPAKLITDSVQRFDQPVWTSDGSIVAGMGSPSTSGGLWVMTRDGGSPRRLAAPGKIQPFEWSACRNQNYVVFTALTNGAYNLWRAEPATGEIRQLTFGRYEHYPQCAADGSVLYAALENGRLVTRSIPLTGGDSTAVEHFSYNDVLSPDGKLVLKAFVDDATHLKYVAIRSRDGGRPILTVPLDADSVAWAPDSRGVAYVLHRVDKWADVWYQAVSGAPPRQLTHFGARVVFSVSWSADGKRLLCARGGVSSDLIMIEDVR